jgi:hypothetical protein
MSSQPPTCTSPSAAPTQSGNATAITAPADLPPFQSTTQFPRKPKAEQLASLYANCFQALQQANVARAVYRSRMDDKKRVIAAIRLEIERFEQDLSLEASTRASLHAMNIRLVEALRKMEGLAGELDEVVSEAHGVPRTGLGRLIEKLKALVRHWRAFKRNERQDMAGGDGVTQDGGSDA